MSSGTSSFRRLISFFFVGAAVVGAFIARSEGSDAFAVFSGNVLVLPGHETEGAESYCRETSLLLASVTIMLRDAEQRASFDPRAEVEYQEGLEAYRNGRLLEASAHLVTAKKYLKEGPRSDFFPDSEPVRLN